MRVMMMMMMMKMMVIARGCQVVVPNERVRAGVLVRCVVCPEDRGPGSGGRGPQEGEAGPIEAEQGLVGPQHRPRAHGRGRGRRGRLQGAQVVHRLVRRVQGEEVKGASPLHRDATGVCPQQRLSHRHRSGQAA